MGHGGDLQGACAASEYRQFDFWVGNWDVNGPRGRFVGTNVVERELDGCVVEENWTNPAGYRGRSMNTYDASTGRWNQMWVDNAGQPLFLEGGLVDGAMIMTGRRVFPDPTLPDGFVVDDSITWTAITPDSVRQHWVMTFNDDPPFTAFDGRYRRVPSVTPLTEVVDPTCTANPAYRQLDFLLGEWVITRGRAHGVDGARGSGPITSVVTTDLSGCLVEDHIDGAGPYRGWSFNAYDPVTDRWHRSYMDNLGQRLALSGALDGSAMVLTGARELAEGGTVHIRLTLTPSGADRVTERWERSADGGATWAEEVELTRVRRR
jgi:hypothetical protein